MDEQHELPGVADTAQQLAGQLTVDDVADSGDGRALYAFLLRSHEFTGHNETCTAYNDGHCERCDCGLVEWMTERDAIMAGVK